MKKSFLFPAIIAAAVFVSCKKEVVVSPAAVPEMRNERQANSVVNDDLPENIREFINKYYNQNDITAYEIKNIPVIGKSYEVKLNNGVEVDLNAEGVWHEWSDPTGLPEDILPENIKSYLKQHYGNTFTTSIDKEKQK